MASTSPPFHCWWPPSHLPCRLCGLCSLHPLPSNLDSPGRVATSPLPPTHLEDLDVAAGDILPGVVLPGDAEDLLGRVDPAEPLVQAAVDGVHQPRPKAQLLGVPVGAWGCHRRGLGARSPPARCWAPCPAGGGCCLPFTLCRCHGVPAALNPLLEPPAAAAGLAGGPGAFPPNPLVSGFPSAGAGSYRISSGSGFPGNHVGLPKLKLAAWVAGGGGWVAGWGVTAPSCNPWGPLSQGLPLPLPIPIPTVQGAWLRMGVHSPRAPPG